MTNYYIIGFFVLTSGISLFYNFKLNKRIRKLQVDTEWKILELEGKHKVVVKAVQFYQDQLKIIGTEK